MRRIAWMDLAAPLITVAAGLLMWSMIVNTMHLQSHLLPSPEMVLKRLWLGLIQERDMWSHLFSTTSAAAMGYALGCGIGILAAVVLAEFATVGRILSPLVQAFQAVPKVAISPVILIWAGFGTQSIVILVAMICFFPCYSNTLISLRSVDENLRSLFRAAGASRCYRLWHLDLPASAGALLTGLQISVGFALVGCVVMEFLLGTSGMGYLIDNSANSLDAATAIASMLLLGMVGAFFSMGIRALRRRFIFWDRGDASSRFQQGGGR